LEPETNQEVDICNIHFFSPVVNLVFPDKIEIDFFALYVFVPVFFQIVWNTANADTGPDNIPCHYQPKDKQYHNAS
jgi:hypothetical protein